MMPRHKRRYYPLCLDIRGRECLVIGGGRVAERKVRRLLNYGAKIRLISPVLSPLLERWAKERRFRHQSKKFSADLFGRPALVFAVTDDLAVNRRIVRESQKRLVPVNVAAPGDLSTFILPAVLRKRSFTVAISTDGRSPRTAKRVREKLEGIL